MLDIKGCIVTIDAMGCQTKIAHAIIERKADYAPAVKENQKELHDNILDTFRFVSKENVTSLEDIDAG